MSRNETAAAVVAVDGVVAASPPPPPSSFPPPLPSLPRDEEGEDEFVDEAKTRGASSSSDRTPRRKGGGARAKRSRKETPHTSVLGKEDDTPRRGGRGGRRRAALTGEEGEASERRGNGWWDGVTATSARFRLFASDDGGGDEGATDDAAGGGAPRNHPFEIGSSSSAGSSSAVDEALRAAYTSFDGHDESLLLDEETGEGGEGNRPHPSRFRKKRGSKERRLLNHDYQGGTGAAEALPSSVPTEEDRVREECAFFYRDVDDVVAAIVGDERKPPARRPRSDTLDPMGDVDAAGEYLPPRSRARFRAEHDALNAKRPSTPPPSVHPSASSYDDEPQFARVADFRNSSLYYRHDGRVHMRLPNDNVRLVMDPHLEPGILSVVRGGGSARGVADDVGQVGSSSVRKTDLSPPSSPRGCAGADRNPSYVLTVDDDLYRRIVKEMADSRSPLGVYYCCQEAEKTGHHVHIGIAMILLAVIFVFLFVTTMIWPY